MSLLSKKAPTVISNRDRHLPAVGTGTKIEIVQGFQNFIQLEGAWNQLVASSQLNSPFLRHEWLRIWWECFGQGDDLLIFAAYSEGRLIGAVPLRKTVLRASGMRLRSFQLLANGHSFRSGILVLPEFESTFVRLFLEYLDNELQPEADVFWFRDLPEAQCQRLSAGASARGLRNSVECPMQCPTVMLQGTWEGYWKAKSPKTRQSLRRKLRRLTELGDVQCKVTRIDRGQEVLQNGLQLEAASWKGREGSAILCSKPVEKFYRLIAEWAENRSNLLLMELKLNGKAIAFDYCLLYEKKLYLLKLAYDENYARYSPGQILRMKAIEWAFEQGLKEYELLGFSMPWKKVWANGYRMHRTFVIYCNSFRGILFYLYQYSLRRFIGRKNMPFPNLTGSSLTTGRMA